MFLINSFFEVFYIVQKGILFLFNIFLYLFISVLMLCILIGIFFNLFLHIVVNNDSFPASKDFNDVGYAGLILPLDFIVLKFESGRDCNVWLFFSEEDFILKQSGFFSERLQTMIKNRDQCIDKIFTINKTFSNYKKYREFKISESDFISYFDFRSINNEPTYGTLVKTQKGNYCEIIIPDKLFLSLDSFYKK